MRVLIGLATAQTMLLAVIGLKVFSLEGDVAAARDASLDALAETAQLRQRASSLQTGARQLAGTFPHTSFLTAEDFRRIMREEIASIPNIQATAPPPRTISKRELNALRGRIDAFVARGAIEPGEMNDLQTTIARLPPDARREMFSRLTKAMNDGDIDGRF